MDRVNSATETKPMTVGDLVRELSRYPDDLRVMVSGYEDGFDDLEPGLLSVQDVALHQHPEWFYGRHDIPFPEDGEDIQTVPALLIRRPNKTDDLL